MLRLAALWLLVGAALASVADVVGVTAVEPAPLAAVVNVVPLGLSPDTVLPWLHGMNHDVPFRTVAWNGTQYTHPRAAAGVTFRHHIRVMRVSPGLVDALDARMAAWVRVGGTDRDGRLVWCVEARHMESFLEDVAAALPAAGPTDATLFLLAPGLLRSLQATAATDVYGYREGLCPADLASAVQDPALAETLEDLSLDAVDAGGDDVLHPDMAPRLDEAHHGGSEPGVAVVDATAATQALLDAEVDYGDMWESLVDADAPDLVLPLSNDHEARRRGVFFRQAQLALASSKLLSGDEHADSDLLREGAGVGLDAKHDDLEGKLLGGLTAPVVDAWVGTGRVGWLDVSGLALEWGPAVGGTGAKRRSQFQGGCSKGQHCGTAIAAAVGKFIQQVVSPPAAVPLLSTPTPGLRSPVTRIAYRLFVVSAHADHGAEGAAPRPGNHAYATHAQYDATGPHGLNVANIRRELLLAKLPHQEVSFSVRGLSVEDDPAVAMAFAMGLRHSVASRLTAGGALTSENRPYLDAAVVVDLLKANTGFIVESKAQAAQQLDVPIFLFSVDSHPPVLVDRHYTARAVQGVVVATQGPQLVWPARVLANGEDVIVSLRNPDKAVIQAALEASSGVLPSHVSVGPAPSNAQRVSQEWSWSVGASVVASAGAGTTVTALTMDATARSMIAAVLGPVWDVVQGSVGDLEGHAGALADDPAVAPLVANVSAAVNATLVARQAVCDHADVGDYVGAYAHIGPLLEATSWLKAASHTLDQELHDVKCAARRQVDTRRPWVWVAAACGLAASALWGILLLNRGPDLYKPHIN